MNEIAETIITGEAISGEAISEETISEEAIHSEGNLNSIKESFFSWVKAHRKPLIMGGVSIAALVGIILGLKNKDMLTELWDSLSRRIEEVPPDILSIEATNAVPAEVSSVVEKTHLIEQYVSPHIRNLHEGQHHSPLKAAEAKAMGIDLLLSQTYVDPYTRKVSVA